MSLRSASVAVAAALAALCAASVASAADPMSATPARASAPVSAGQRIYIDPATGERVEKPQSAVHRAIADDLPRRDDTKMKQIVVPGVGVMMHAGGQLQMTEFVHRDANGKLAQDCVESPKPKSEAPR